MTDRQTDNDTGIFLFFQRAVSLTETEGKWTVHTDVLCLSLRGATTHCRGERIINSADWQQQTSPPSRTDRDGYSFALCCSE